MSKNGARNLAIGTAVAAAAGYITGILTAPKSGKDTRKDIQTAATKAKRDAEDQLKKFHSELGDLIKTGKTKVLGVKTSAQKDFKEALNRAETAKEKARDLLSSLHEGDVDDKDLQKAVADVKDAIDHLKVYVQKKTPSKS